MVFSSKTKGPPDAFRQDTAEFLVHLQQFFACRQQMSDKNNEIDPKHHISKIPVTPHSKGIQNANGTYKPEYQQQTVHGQPVTNIEQLYLAAQHAKPEFEKYLKKIMNAVVKKKATKDKANMILLAPLKGAERAMEKARDDYAGRTPGPGVSWLYDIVRASILCETAEQIVAIVTWLQRNGHVVKVKNRFQNPTPSGYRDLNFHIQIQVPMEGSNKTFSHICEVQIHHKQVKLLDKKLDAHHHYEFFRMYFAGSNDTVEERIQDLQLLTKGGKDGSSLDQSFVTKLIEQSKDAPRLKAMGFLFGQKLCEFEWALQILDKALNLKKQDYAKAGGKTLEKYTDFLLRGNHFRTTIMESWNFKELDATRVATLQSVQSTHNTAKQYGKQRKRILAMQKYEHAFRQLERSVDANRKELAKIPNLVGAQNTVGQALTQEDAAEQKVNELVHEQNELKQSIQMLQMEYQNKKWFLDNQTKSAAHDQEFFGKDSAMTGYAMNSAQQAQAEFAQAQQKLDQAKQRASELPREIQAAQRDLEQRHDETERAFAKFQKQVKTSQQTLHEKEHWIVANGLYAMAGILEGDTGGDSGTDDSLKFVNASPASFASYREKRKKRSARAFSLYQQAALIYENALTKEHYVNLGAIDAGGVSSRNVGTADKNIMTNPDTKMELEAKLADAYVDMAQAQIKMGSKASDCLETAEKALAVKANHVGAAELLVNVGDMQQGDAALDTYTKAKNLLVKSLGQEHVSVAQVFCKIGDIHADKKRAEYQKAHDFYQEALEIYVKLYGEKHQVTRETKKKTNAVFKKAEQDRKKAERQAEKLAKQKAKETAKEQKRKERLEQGLPAEEAGCGCVIL